MTDLDLNQLLLAIKSCLNPQQDTFVLHEPLFKGNEKNYVQECIDTGWVSSLGKFVDKFEKDLADYTGAAHAVVTMNGTAALHMAFLLAGVKPGDEVLMPALTFVATANAVSYCNAIPHFVDSEEITLGVDPVKLAYYLEEIVVIKNGVAINRLTHRPIRALCAVHIFGHPADLDALLAICQKYSIILIEDAAEALGSFYKDVHVGYKGLIGALSFNGNKIITTGGGGAILTNDPALAKQAKYTTTTAKKPHPWLYYHDQLGYNYRMPNLNAALGCAQLEQLPHFLAIKRALSAKYQRALAPLKGVKFITEPKDTKSNYWLNAILLDADYSHLRDPFLTLSNQQGIMTRPVWNLINQLPMYAQSPQMDLAAARHLAARLINLPSSVSLGVEIPA